MTDLALYVRLEAKPGKEQEVADLLVAAQALVEKEPDAVAWFALRIAPSTFAILAAFSGEQGRDAHLNGKVAAMLTEKAPDLFANQVDIRQCEVIADKLPH